MTRLVDCRYIAIDRETAEVIERAGKELLRRNEYSLAVPLLALHLKWRKAAGTQRLEFEEIPTPESLRVDADAQPRDVPARTLRLVEGETA